MSDPYNDYHARAQSGMLERFGRLIEQRLADRPDDAALRRRLAENLRARGELDQARSHFQELVRTNPDDAHLRDLSRILSGDVPEGANPDLDDPSRPTPFVIMDGLLDDDELAALRLLVHESNDEFRPSSVGYGDNKVRLDPDTRNNLQLKTSWPDRVLVPRVKALLPRVLPRLCVRDFPLGRIESSITWHGDGCFFRPHFDRNSQNGRRVSFLLYFDGEHHDYHGGDLVLYDHQPEDGLESGTHLLAHTRIIPRPNRLVLFPSHRLHEVTRVHRPDPLPGGGRYAILGFIREAGNEQDHPSDETGH
ncbi:MAG: 2OG-Fe(II) oxygenase [Gammaproteobacteria bacterium]